MGAFESRKFPRNGFCLFETLHRVGKFWQLDGAITLKAGQQTPI